MMRQISKGVEKLDHRNLAASMLYAIDVFGEDGVQLDVPDSRPVEIGEILTVEIKVAARYDEGGVDPGYNDGGVFAWGADLLSNSQTLKQGNVSAADDFYSAFAISSVTEYDVPVDDVGTVKINDIGGGLSSYLNGIHETGEDWVHVASIEYEVLDTPGMFTGVSLEVDEVDRFYDSLILGAGSMPVDAVLAGVDDGENAFWFSSVKASGPSLHNSEFPSDVNGDELLEPIDLLLIINDLAVNGNRSIENAVEDGNVPSSQVDVNNDGTIGQGEDALMVLAELNNMYTVA